MRFWVVMLLLVGLVMAGAGCIADEKPDKVDVERARRTAPPVVFEPPEEAPTED
jgi:hypothetical protein